MNKVQIIWNGCDGFVVADENNSQVPNYPVRDSWGVLAKVPEFEGQRAVYRAHGCWLGELATEVTGTSVPNFDGHCIIDGRVFKF
jgi:hypothetical protein